MCFHKEKQKLNRTWNITKLYIKQIVFEFAFLIMLFSSCCFYFHFFKTEAWSTTHYKTKQSLFYVSDLFRKASGCRRTMDATWMGIIFLLFLQKRDLFFILFHQINVFQTIKSKNDKINYQANSHFNFTQFVWKGTNSYNFFGKRSCRLHRIWCNSVKVFTPLKAQINISDQTNVIISDKENLRK